MKNVTIIGGGTAGWLPEKLSKLLDDNNRLKVFINKEIRRILEVPYNDNMTVFTSYAYGIVSSGNFKKSKKLF